MISVENVSKSYGIVDALRGISFDVGGGEIVGLLGPNGAGKTTTMKILTGYLQPTEGTARVDGIDVVDDPLAVQGRVGYLPENAPIYLDMAVQEYLGLMADLRQIPDSRRRSLLSRAIWATGIEPYLTRTIGSLSKGFRQRVGLAQAILHEPKVLILDEPTNGLDPNQIIEIRDLIRRLAENATVMVSTHILSEVEATCHRAIIIMNGLIKADARLDELTSTSSAVVAVEGDDEDVRRRLEAVATIDGVEKIDPGRADAPWTRWRVTGPKGTELCPLIHDQARDAGWRLHELRAETRTLESVFRQMAREEGVAA